VTHRPKFYVATDFARKEEALGAAALLEARGLELNARWLTSQPVLKEGGLGGELEGDHAAAALEIAQQDLDDIRASHVFVQLTSGEKARGGRHVELGFALALACHDRVRAVLAVGPREHAFHYHPHVTHLPSAGDLSHWAAGYVSGAKL
jgi:hypothetical protein